MLLVPGFRHNLIFASGILGAIAIWEKSIHNSERHCFSSTIKEKGVSNSKVLKEILSNN